MSTLADPIVSSPPESPRRKLLRTAVDDCYVEPELPAPCIAADSAQTLRVTVELTRVRETIARLAQDVEGLATSVARIVDRIDSL